jgi:cyclophilin family peptidyl-prolyl cis-trans isomerase
LLTQLSILVFQLRAARFILDGFPQLCRLTYLRGSSLLGANSTVFRPFAGQFVCCGVFALALFTVDLAEAVDDDAPSPPAKITGDKAAVAFKTDFVEWKGTISGLRAVRQEYQDAIDDDQRQALREKFDELLAKGRALIPVLRETGIAAYSATPDENPELTRFLFKVAKDELARDMYDRAWELGELLVEKDCGFPEIYNIAGVAAFVRNDYDKAKEYLTIAQQRGVLDSVGRTFVEQIEQCRTLWQEEQKLREQQAGKLPLVELETTKGNITIELFENEAPQTVGNFIYLVKKGFYDGLAFHEVEAGLRAITGCPKGDGTGDDGYKIYCECYIDNHRNHFRGSLSMETEGTKDTAGSRFFVSFAPTPRLNGRFTVFGRVVDGMDVLAKLERTAPSSPSDKPDKIVKAKILRIDENKKYLPVKVKE